MKNKGSKPKLRVVPSKPKGRGRQKIYTNPVHFVLIMEKSVKDTLDAALVKRAATMTLKLGVPVSRNAAAVQLLTEAVEKLAEADA